MAVDPEQLGTLIESQLGDDFSEENDDSCSERGHDEEVDGDFGVTE